MGEAFKLVFTGEILEGFDREKVISDFGVLTGIDEVRAREFIEKGKPSLIKKNLDAATTKKYTEHLERIGMQIQVLPLSGEVKKPLESFGESQQDDKGVGGPEQPENKVKESPNWDVEQPNPYAAPKSNLAVSQAQKDRVTKPIKRPASHGFRWITAAFSMFLRHPFKWMGMSFVAFICVAIISFIPLLGSFINIFPAILFGGGFMLAAQQQYEGEEYDFGVIFSGFTHHTRGQLLLIGVIYIGIMLALFAISAIVIFVVMLAFYGTGNGWESAFFEMMRTPLFFIVFGVIMLITIPIMMSYWFTAPLVAVGELNATESYKLSFKGVLINWLPFLIYGIAFFVFGVIFMIIMSVLGGGIGFLAGQNQSILGAIIPMLIFGVLMIPMAVIGVLSVFTSFKDIYFEQA